MRTPPLIRTLLQGGPILTKFQQLKSLISVIIFIASNLKFTDSSVILLNSEHTWLLINFGNYWKLGSLVHTLFLLNTENWYLKILKNVTILLRIRRGGWRHWIIFRDSHYSVKMVPIVLWRWTGHSLTCGGRRAETPWVEGVGFVRSTAS